MKSTNIYNLRTSVNNGVWSSTNGANKVLQSAWDDRQEDEKIIFMFSITHRYGTQSSKEGRQLITKQVAISTAANMLEWQRCRAHSIQTPTLRSGLQV